jgi:hypothetical protein
MNILPVQPHHEEAEHDPYNPIDGISLIKWEDVFVWPVEVPMVVHFSRRLGPIHGDNCQMFRRDLSSETIQSCLCGRHRYKITE